jgi:hypothetical protein
MHNVHDDVLLTQTVKPTWLVVVESFRVVVCPAALNIEVNVGLLLKQDSSGCLMLGSCLCCLDVQHSYATAMQLVLDFAHAATLEVAFQ